MFIPVTGNESPAHQKAKLRLFQIVRSMGMIADFEISTGRIETPLGTRNYTIDVLAFSPIINKRIAFEVDGKRGHAGRWNAYKNRNRDNSHKEQKRILTVRVNTKRLVGKTKWSDEDIIGFINDELNRI